MVTDAAGNVTTTVYCDCCDQPASITKSISEKFNEKIIETLRQNLTR
jgi:hypothetical protein